ncbi:MAG: hypothetical protein JWO02_3873 [Solirubrobacterales bacterium]|nr:hypothetical protein [Solirubrobacterales bacterium]
MTILPARPPRLVAILLLSTVAVGASAAPAPAALSVGIAEQKVQMFTDPHFKELNIRKARRLVPWDAMNLGYERDAIDEWVSRARAVDARPLITFGHSRQAGREHVAPTPAQLVAQFRKFRERYPDVTEFATWNEPNLCGEPLCHKPELAARYYDALTAACPDCTILAAEVLDGPTMASWVTAFMKHVKHKPRFWGLHNYLDANRMRTSGTRELLRLVTGQLWFTETGGIVKRRTTNKAGGFPETVAHAGVATRWIFDRLVPLSPRITRVYLYHWNPAGPRDSWDSALFGLDGRPRPSFLVVKARIARIAAARRTASARRR